MRSLSFDQKFKNGDWNFQCETPDLVRLVEQYCSKGHLLVLGCGTACIGSELSPDSYDTLTGIDLSPAAIAIASARACQNATFKVADMVKYRCPRLYDVILFSDSLYYVNYFVRKAFLQRMCQSLTSEGRIIVKIADPRRYGRTLKLIRRNFAVDVDRNLEGTRQHVLIFRARDAEVAISNQTLKANKP